MGYSEGVEELQRKDTKFIPQPLFLTGCNSLVCFYSIAPMLWKSFVNYNLVKIIPQSTSFKNIIAFELLD